MAEPASPPTLTDFPADGLVGKIALLGRRVRQGRDAEVREAVTRTELTLALTEALLGRSQALAQAQRLAAQAYFSDAPFPPRRHNRISRKLDAALMRFGSLGRAVVIARAGVWRGTGRPVFDFRHMAAYARRGASPAVQPPALFDQAWYLDTNPDVAASGASPLVHYLTAGAREGRSPHPLFHVDFYTRANAAELGGAGVTPLEHFSRVGGRRGLDPHPLFDMDYYASQAPDLERGEDLVSHYVRIGWGRGLSPHRLFDADWYVRQIPRAERSIPSLIHYLTIGWRQGLSPHPLFDPAWYLEDNPDVAADEVEPLTHFVLTGADEGRSPGPWFDLPHYVAVRGGALPTGRNPLVDYLEGGAWIVSEPRPGFPTAAYLAVTPELARTGVTPLEHWARRSAQPEG